MLSFHRMRTKNNHLLKDIFQNPFFYYQDAEIGDEEAKSVSISNFKPDKDDDENILEKDDDKDKDKDEYKNMSDKEVEFKIKLRDSPF